MSNSTYEPADVRFYTRQGFTEAEAKTIIDAYRERDAVLDRNFYGGVYIPPEERCPGAHAAFREATAAIFARVHGEVAA